MTDFRIDTSDHHGYGVIAERDIATGEAFTFPVFVIPEGTMMPTNMTYDWTDGTRSICAGEPSLINNSATPNMEISSRDMEAKTMTFTALSNISTGDECFITYASGAPVAASEPTSEGG